MAINSGKVVAGGLVGGVVMNGLDYLWYGVLLKDQYAAELNAVNPALSAKSVAAPSMIAGIAGDFVVALIIVTVYAAFRAVWGPGPKTALRAGFAIWCIGLALYAPLAAGGLYSWHFYCLGSLTALVSVLAGALAGGAVYKE